MRKKSNYIRRRYLMKQVQESFVIIKPFTYQCTTIYHLTLLQKDSDNNIFIFVHYLIKNFFLLSRKPQIMQSIYITIF